MFLMDSESSLHRWQHSWNVPRNVVIPSTWHQWRNFSFTMLREIFFGRKNHLLNHSSLLSYVVHSFREYPAERKPRCADYIPPLITSNTFLGLKNGGNNIFLRKKKYSRSVAKLTTHGLYYCVSVALSIFVLSIFDIHYYSLTLNVIKWQ